MIRTEHLCKTFGEGTANPHPVLHDINLSSRYADHMFALAKGELVTQGTPREVVTVDTMRRVFDLDCEIIDDPVSGTPLIVPRGKCVP